MGRVRRIGADLRGFLASDPDRRRLLVRAWVACAGAALALRLLPFSLVRSLFARAAPAPPDGWAVPAAGEADRIAGAVRTASRRVPGGDGCLPRALAAAVLLRRAGHPATVRIGVRDGREDAAGPLFDGDGIDAHAWVTGEGRVLVGDLEDLDSFRTLGDLDPPSGGR